MRRTSKPPRSRLRLSTTCAIALIQKSSKRTYTDYISGVTTKSRSHEEGQHRDGVVFWQVEGRSWNCTNIFRRPIAHPTQLLPMFPLLLAFLRVFVPSR